MSAISDFVAGVCKRLGSGHSSDQRHRAGSKRCGIARCGSHCDADRHRRRAQHRHERNRIVCFIEPGPWAVPPGGGVAGFPYLCSDRNRPAGEQQSGDQSGSEVGQVSEQVEVQANAALVETRSQGVGQVIENERILELPLNGRQVTDLITLAGRRSRRRPVAPILAGQPFFSIGGGIPFGVDYTLDGANHINFLTGVTMPLPFPDATQEFKVETSGLGATHGSGSAMSAVTKSGTNELHGDLFEFVRNDLFNARQYFATKNSTLKRNQFGGTIGGPIVKNKLFFFGGYQGTIIRQDPANIQSFLPTAAMMAGDWTAFTSPACNAGRQITL